MKCFIFLAIACATIGFSEQALTKDQAIEMFKKLAEDCLTAEGATTDDLEEAMAGILPSTKSGKCMRACVAEKIGVMKDNKMSVEGHAALAKMAFDNDPDKVQKAIEIANECEGITDADRCEAALKLFLCGDKAAKEKGISFDDW